MPRDLHAKGLTAWRSRGVTSLSRPLNNLGQYTTFNVALFKHRYYKTLKKDCIETRGLLGPCTKMQVQPKEREGATIKFGRCKNDDVIIT